ncbi:hypothetical protein TRVA0_006S01640 [Trichomonascus vanleenenianus]|uniref:uncharacterized protein n=1 Tax=Trichomonascus vanleenenianus TaxID=2268995 RepID=UPI003ECB5B46
MTRGQQHPGLPARYQFVTDLNKGSYGVVSLFRDSEAPVDDNLVAIKSIFKSNPQHLHLHEEARQEIRVHKLLGNSHPHIVKLLDHYETPECTYLVMEYYPNGDLYEAIRGERGPSHIESIRQFMLQLIDAVEFCHSKGIYHRDIKPENILIGTNHMVKLADFGLATTSRICNEFGVGSERYMAPELFDETYAMEYNAEKSDIWSIGICLLNILFCRNPFTVACEKDKLFMDFASNREALFDIFPTLSSDTFAVLRHALTIDPDNRSLAKMRDELLNVQIWTIDDDDYYDDEQLEPVPIPQIAVSDEVVGQEPFAGGDVAQGDDDTITTGMATAVDEFITTTTNRQPLRTPSIAVEAAAFSYSKPWIRTMQFTPPSKPLMMMGGSRPKRPSHLSSRLDSISSEDEEEHQDDGAGSGSQSGDYDDDVFVMDLNSPLSKMSIRNSSDSSSLNSVPSLVQSIASTSTTATTNTTAQQQSKLSASLPTWKGPVPPRRQPTTTNPGSAAAGGPTKNMPIPGSSAPNSNRDFLKFTTSWSDLAFEDDDDDDLSLHSDDFYEFIKSEFPMTLPGALSKGVKAGGWS